METDRKIASEGFATQLKRIRRTFIFLSTVKVQVAITAAAIIAFCVTEMICLMLLKPVIDTVQHIGPGEVAHYSGFFNWFFASEGSGAALRHGILLLLIMKVVLGITLWAKTVATAWQSMSMVFYMRAAVYDKLQRVGFSFHDEYATGQLINRSLSDLQNVRNFIMTGLGSIIEIVIVLVSYFFMLWFQCSPKIAIAAMLPLPLWFWAIRRFAVLAQPIYEGQTKAQDKMVEVLTENIAGVHVIRAFATEDLERQKFQVAAGHVRSRLMEAVTLRVKMIPMIRGIAILSSVGLFALGAVLTQRHELSIGALAILGGAMGNLLGRIQLVNQIADGYQQAVVSSKRLFDMLDSPSNTPERADAEPLLPGAGGVRFHHVSFSYDPGHPVSDDIGFTIKPGSIVAIVGPTGSGKTTLAALLGRFYDPDLGRIEIDGQDLRDVTLRSVREAVGYVFQETYLFSDTIARNIAYGDLSASREKIREAARLARADEFIDRLPAQYDQVIGEYGASLSGGQKQRLAIARAILHNPRILVLDDALASVDPETESLIRQGLERIMRGRTVFMITSRISSARRAHHILVVQRGKIAQSGTHDELMRVEGYYRDVASSQFAEETQLDEHSHMDRMTRLSASAQGGLSMSNGSPKSSGNDTQIVDNLRNLVSPEVERTFHGLGFFGLISERKHPPPEKKAGGREDDDESRFKPISAALIWRLLKCLKPYRWLYAIGTIAGVFGLACQLLMPKVQKWIIDDAIPTNQLNPILKFAAMWAGLWALALFADVFQIWATNRCGEQVILDLRLAVFNQLQRLGMSFYDRTKLGRIITRGTSDLDSLRATVIGGINTVALNVLLMIGAGLMILLADWRLFLSVAWLAPLIACTNQIYRHKIGGAWQQVRAAYSRVASNLAENITGVRVVSAFNRQDENLDRFNALQEINTANNVRANHITGVYMPLLDFLGFIGQVIILAYGGARVVAGDFTVGKVIEIFALWSYFISPMRTMGDFYNTLMQAMASGERVFALLDMKPDIEDAPDAKPLPRITGNIHFDHVTFGYDPERPVLWDINLEIPSGKTYALVGATGSGKSSTVSLLARFYEFQQGRILVDGIDIRSATRESLHKQMGLVLQVNYLFSGTILENIRYPRPTATDDDVYAAAKSLGIHETFLNLPQGYQTEVGERGASVSMGLRQLICFTRVLLANSSIFLLDEATSSIDTVTEQKVQKALEKLVQGRTTIIVAHRLSTIVKADCIVVLQQGRIIERGSHAELLEKKGHYASLYEQFISHSQDKDSGLRPAVGNPLPQPAPH